MNKKKLAPKGKKKKMELAKDPKQAAMAVIVIIAFLLTSIYNIVAYYKSEYASAPPPASNSDPATEMSSGEDFGRSGELSNRLPQDAEDIYAQTLKLKGDAPVQTPPNSVQNTPAGMVEADPESEVSVMSSSNSKRQSGKKVMIAVNTSGRSNPFLPAGENYAASSLPKFTILPPPEQLSMGSEASTVMETTISGILYDKYSPSAIITIAGSDYLVKKGDVINKYNILSITKNQVVVQLGKNVYKAGVGEILSQGQMNYNTVSNLNKKFGGNEIPINVRKKGY